MWDLTDEEVQEEMAESPEAWILDKIVDQSVRIILGRMELRSLNFQYSAYLH
jgi:hypothetical protein